VTERARDAWRRLGAVLACTAAFLPGCAADEETACRLAWLYGEGFVVVEDPLGAPLDTTEVRRVICMRGVVPCAEETVGLRSSAAEVAGVFRDAEVTWVFYVVGLSPGSATVRLTCGSAEEHAFEVEVR